MRSLQRSWLLLVLVLSPPALAQAADGGHVVGPRSANPGGADDPAELARNMDPGDGGAMDADGGAGVTAEVALPPATPAVLVDDEVSGKINASVRVSYQRTSNFPADNLGTEVANNPFETRLRVNPEVHFRGFGFAAEADTATGALIGLPPEGVFAGRTAHPVFNALDLRQLYLEYKWKTGVFRVGQQTSHWGLGILANAGAKDAEAGDFGQQHFGTLAYRALLAGRPLFNLGGAFRAIETVLAADLVVRDSTADFLNEDRAYQAVLALRFNQDADHNLGVYLVYRNQRAQRVTDMARATDAVVVDLAGRWQFAKTDYRAFNIGFEIAGITGTTTQGRNDNAPVLNVRQLGAAMKMSFRYGRAQVYLDSGFASGDENPNDDKLENFRFDRDYKVGLILFDEVHAWQSARSAFRAADPDLLGVPPEGVALAPTGGAITSAWYLFPRFRYGVRDWLDVYGGPLFAFSTARLTDPFNARVGGGTAINYLGGRPGKTLGTELDVGVQARWKPIEMLLLTFTFEGGLLLPGNAFRMENGEAMGPVGMARLRLAASL